jgi:uncharacterized membrane protein YhfC
MELISGIGMVLVGFAFVTYWNRKRRVPFKPFLFGALLWVIGVSLKFAVAIPVNHRFLKLLLLSLHSIEAQIIYYTYVGLLTGVFECAFCYLVIKYSKLRDYNFDNAIAFGIGFGSTEAILIGFYSLIQVLLSGVSAQSSLLLSIPVPIIERISTLFVHIFCSVLIFYSIRNRQISYFLLSFFIKTFFDGLAGWFNIAFIHSLSNIWIVEALTAIVGILSLSGLYWMRNKYMSTNNP